MSNKKKTVHARVTVYPRPEILDPQGTAIAGALERLGFDQVAEVRAGKSFDITLNKVTTKQAEKVAAEIADKLLANTVVEDYRVEVADEDEDAS